MSAEPATEPSATIAEPDPLSGFDLNETPNFYEILQISARADLDTIHRVFRIMAARFHPDNPVSGNHERFLQLCQAYEVLSRPERRAQYDTVLRLQGTRPMPIFEARAFLDGVDAEMNRRFGVLALLYRRRRLNEANPGISTLVLEKHMSIPREYLEFTLWYLRNKAYIQILEENSDYAITASGVDYVEANSSKNHIVRELLTAAGQPAPITDETVTVRRKRRRNR
jgi:curved DNA-binding protein CbpA